MSKVEIGTCKECKFYSKYGKISASGECDNIQFLNQIGVGIRCDTDLSFNFGCIYWEEKDEEV